MIYDFGSRNEFPQSSPRRRFKNEIVGKKNWYANHEARSFIKENGRLFSANDHSYNSNHETKGKLSKIVDDQVCESRSLPARHNSLRNVDVVNGMLERGG